MTIVPGVVLPEAEIAENCRRCEIKELSVFGSAARGELRTDSDIDLPVEFLPEAKVGLFEAHRGGTRIRRAAGPKGRSGLKARTSRGSGLR